MISRIEAAFSATLAFRWR